jgi:hypothetical protein
VGNPARIIRSLDPAHQRAVSPTERDV